MTIFDQHLFTAGARRRELMVMAVVAVAGILLMLSACKQTEEANTRPETARPVKLITLSMAGCNRKQFRYRSKDVLNLDAFGSQPVSLVQALLRII